MLFRTNLPRRVPLQDEDFIQAMLDPNCKASNLFNRYISTDDCMSLLNQFANQFNESNQPSSPNDVSGASRSSDVLDLINSMKSVNNVAPLVIVNNADVLAYLSSSRETANVAEYWKMRKDNSLSKLFRKYGSILNSTATCERTFSRTSLIDQKKRSSLLKDNLKAIIFIHENYVVCKDFLDLISESELIEPVAD